MIHLWCILMIFGALFIYGFVFQQINFSFYLLTYLLTFICGENNESVDYLMTKSICMFDAQFILLYLYDYKGSYNYIILIFRYISVYNTLYKNIDKVHIAISLRQKGWIGCGQTVQQCGVVSKPHHTSVVENTPH